MKVLLAVVLARRAGADTVDTPEPNVHHRPSASIALPSGHYALVTTNPWLAAADDLGVAVTAPAVVGGEDCLALVHDFGSPVGTAVMGRGAAREPEVRAAARALGHYVSIVNPDSYAIYDRDLFVGTLDDWGWYGSGDPPPWYSGRAWGHVAADPAPLIGQDASMAKPAEILMEVVEEFAAFLDLGDADDLSPEFAEWGRMRLKTIVAQLPDDAKNELAAFLARRHEGSGGEYRQWIADLPARLGLT